MKYIRYTVLLLIVMITPYWSAAQHKIMGDWEGAINVMGQELIIKTHFSITGADFKGTIDIPQQGATGIKLDSIKVTGQDSVFFEFFAGRGTAAFRGAIEVDSINGTFSQNGQYFPFYLARSQSKEPQKEAIDPDELLIKTDSVTIAGSLRMPDEQTAETVVILISGSGAQERDENVMGFRVFKHLADSLAKNAIATYRFDDRGAGKSTGDFAKATLDRLIDDVNAIISYFQSSAEHNFDEIILLGHSQGGLVASGAAVDNPAVGGVILMASPGLPMRNILRYQVRDQFAASGISEQWVEKEIQAREDLFDAIKKGKNINRAKNEYRKQFAEIQQAARLDSAQAHQVSKQQVTALASAFGTPQTQSLYDHDPAKILHKLEVPVLALFGGKDTQVPPAENRKPVEQALNKSTSEAVIKTFDQANHLFQKAETGQVSEYASLDKQFFDGFSDFIANWVHKIARNNN